MITMYLTKFSYQKNSQILAVIWQSRNMLRPITYYANKKLFMSNFRLLK